MSLPDTPFAKVDIPLSAELYDQLFPEGLSPLCPNAGKLPSKDGSFRYIERFSSLSEETTVYVRCSICGLLQLYQDGAHSSQRYKTRAVYGQVESLGWNAEDNVIDIDRENNEDYALALRRPTWNSPIGISIGRIRHRFPSATILHAVGKLIIFQVEASEIEE